MLKKREAIAKTDRTLCFIRCFEECVHSFLSHASSSPSSSSKLFPVPICYQRSKVYFKIDELAATAAAVAPVAAAASTIAPIAAAHDSNIYLFDVPVDDTASYEAMLHNFDYLNSERVIDSHVVEYLVSNGCVGVTALGKWIQVIKIKKTSDDDKSSAVKLKTPLWLLKYRYGVDEQQLKFVDITSTLDRLTTNNNNSQKNWLLFVEASFALVPDQGQLEKRFKPNLDLMRSLSEVPKGWSFEHDEELVRLIKDYVNMDAPGSIKNMIKKIDVTSMRTSEDLDYLISLDKRTFWESDSYADTYNGYNAIKLFLKPHIRIKRLLIVVSKKNRHYMPKEVQVYGGDTSDDTTLLNKVIIKSTEDGDISILDNCARVYPFIEIRIKSCQKAGTNCRVYGVKIFTHTEDEEQMPSDIFLSDKLLQRNFAKLGHFKPTFLYRRSELLLRFVKLFDIIMDVMVPSWTYGEHFDNLIKSIKQLLILSSKRITLLDKILNSVPTTACYPPCIYIDRPLAFAYRGKISLDPDYQNTIFMQIYNNLRRESRSYSFRWDKHVEQWWECKFIGEGIIDQGGGFRDSLSDISEELCPNTTDLETPVPLPFFVRSPNQHQSDLNTFRDTYVPNPSCQRFEEYVFIGKLMGACLRSKENLALYLAPYFWKRLSGELYTWRGDFVTVDAAEVRLVDAIEKLADKHEYEVMSGERTWTCVLSDGTVHELRPNGAQQPVTFEERGEYCAAVRRARLAESDKQIDAIKKGLQSVVSKHVFSILTWSEFELKICGTPQITLEDLKMSIEYEDELCANDNRVKFFWEAMKNFSNEERSKFVRFVTGRKRLPVKIFFCASEQPATSFPDSSTCNCSIYFPNYPNAQVAEEKLRYAIHNCVAIDTDCTSYDD